MTKRLVIGVDFDGTIVEEAFPNIGEIKHRTVELMRKAKDEGHLVIVWTARSNEREKECIDFLNKHNIPYDYINENPEDEYALRGEQGRKIFCDVYLDDRAVHVDDINKVFDKLNGKEKGTSAVLLREIKLFELDSFGDDINEDEVVVFIQGEEVEVVREVKYQNGLRQFIIYSERLNETTVVGEHILEFKE